MKTRERIEAGLYSDMPVLGDSLHHYELNYHGYERQPVEINADSLVAKQDIAYPVNKSRGIFPFQYIGISVDGVIAGVIEMNGNPAISEGDEMTVNITVEAPLFVCKTFKPMLSANEVRHISGRNGEFDPESVGTIS